MKKILFKNINPKISVKFVTSENFIYDTNSVYLFLKFLFLSDDQLKILKKLRKLNNFIIYEPLDYGWKYNENMEEYVKYMLERFQYFDMALLNNDFMVETFKKEDPTTKFRRNYHEFDKFFNVNKKKVVPEVYYIGDLYKCSFTKDMMKKYGIEYVRTSIANEYNKEIFKNKYSSGIHIDYVKPDHVYHPIHTSTKLGTALNFNSVFICNRLPIYEELLGKDYEFFFNHDLSDLKEVIKKAKKLVQSKKQYEKYLEKTNKIKFILSPKSILKNYEKTFFKADQSRKQKK